MKTKLFILFVVGLSSSFIIYSGYPIEDLILQIVLTFILIVLWLAI